MLESASIRPAATRRAMVVVDPDGLGTMIPQKHGQPAARMGARRDVWDLAWLEASRGFRASGGLRRGFPAIAGDVASARGSTSRQPAAGDRLLARAANASG